MGEMVAIYQDIPTKAYVVEEKGGPFILKDVVLDEVRADEVLVEIKYSGLCHTVRLFPRSLFYQGYEPDPCICCRTSSYNTEVCQSVHIQLSWVMKQLE